MFPERGYLDDSRPDLEKHDNGSDHASLSRDPTGAEPSCPICLLGFALAAPLRTTPCCGNDYHSPCLSTWLTKARGVCPTCRYPFSARLELGGTERREVAATYEQVQRALEEQRARRMVQSGETIVEVPAIEMEIRRQ